MPTLTFDTHRLQGKATHIYTHSHTKKKQHVAQRERAEESRKHPSRPIFLSVLGVLVHDTEGYCFTSIASLASWVPSLRGQKTPKQHAHGRQ